MEHAVCMWLVEVTKAPDDVKAGTVNSAQLSVCQYPKLFIFHHYIIIMLKAIKIKINSITDS